MNDIVKYSQFGQTPTLGGAERVAFQLGPINAIFTLSQLTQFIRQSLGLGDAATAKKTDFDAAGAAAGFNSLSVQRDDALSERMDHLQQDIDNAKNGANSYRTLALANAAVAAGDIPANTSLRVTLDPTTAKNGLYDYDGLTLEKSSADELTQAKAYADANALFKPVFLSGSGVNLNSYENDGIHFIDSTVTAENGLNFPVPRGGVMIAYAPNKTAQIRVQQYIAVGTRQIFSRFKVGNNWDEAWTEQATTAQTSIAKTQAIADAKIYSDQIKVSAVSDANTATDTKLRRYARADNVETPNGILIAFTDKNGHRTWLEVNSDDGGLTPLAKKHIDNVLGAEQKFISNGEYFYALIDSQLNLTDIALRPDGQFADFVVARLKKRLAINLTGNTQDRYLKNGKLAWLNADRTKIIGWGSSSMDRSAPAMTAIAGELGAVYADCGVGGDYIENIAARMGAIPAKVKVHGGSIPASGSVDVTANVGGYTIPIRSSEGDYAGYLNGVLGTLSYISASSPYVRFTRTTAGSAITVNPATEFDFIPAQIELHKKAVTLLWPGKNNITYEADSIADTATRVIAGTDTMFNFLDPQALRCLVLGHYTNGDYVVNGLPYQRLMAVNAGYKAKYGELFVDVQAYLMSNQVWSDTAITPTAQDLTDQNNGITPASLRLDTGHLTAAVFSVMCEKLIKTKIINLGWY